MIVLKEGKQVGNLSYLVESLEILLEIITSGKINKTRRPERNPVTRKDEYSVSFSRDLTNHAVRNSKRWYCGVIVDGDKLSDRYKIVPYDFNYNQAAKSNGIRIKSISAYEDNTYYMYVVNRGTIKISKNDYYILKDYIENLDDATKLKNKLDDSEADVKASRKYKGRYRVDKYEFRVPNGLRVDLQSIGVSDISRHPDVTDTEERIWTNTDVDISKCIVGIVIPKEELGNIENSDDEIYADIRDAMNSRCSSWDIVTY